MRNMNKLFFPLVLIFILQSVPALAAKLDLKKSHIQWTGSKLGGSFHTGKFHVKEANITEESGVVKGGVFIIDVAGMTNEDLEGEKQTKFLTHMKSPDFFDVEKFPTATFTLTKLTDKEVEGNLTLKDKSQPIKATFVKKDNVYTGSFMLNRTKHGIVYNSKNFFKDTLAERVINDEVKLEFHFVVE